MSSLASLVPEHGSGVQGGGSGNAGGGSFSGGGSLGASSLSLVTDHHHSYLASIHFPPGLFHDALVKIVTPIHPALKFSDDVIDEIERLVYKMLAKILQPSGSAPIPTHRGFPSSVKEVSDTIRKIFPAPLDKLIIDDASAALESRKESGKRTSGWKNKSPVVPMDSLTQVIQKEYPGIRIDGQVLTFLVAFVEYMAADIWKLVVKYMKNIRQEQVTGTDVKIALHSDHIILDILNEEDLDFSFISEGGSVGKRTSLTYEENVKEFILEEEQHIRDLNMLIKVFRSSFLSLRCHGVTEEDVDVIFRDIGDIHASVVNFHGLLEDMMEMTSENSVPSVPQVGTCFMEMAEGAEFDVFLRYAEDVLHPETFARLHEILAKPDVIKTLSSAGKGFKDSVKYMLPKLLLGPIYHFFHYFDILKTFVELTHDEKDRETLSQVEGILSPLNTRIVRICTRHEMPQKRKHWENSLRFQTHLRDRKTAVLKMIEIQKRIEGWEGKDLQQCCNELLIEGKLLKYVGKGSRAMFGKTSEANESERYGFLFDSLLVLCKSIEKPSRKMSTVVSGGSSAATPEFRLKKKYFIRRLEVTDCEDLEDVKHAFVLSTRRGHGMEKSRGGVADAFNAGRGVRDVEALMKGNADNDSIILCAKTAEEKNHWMATLVALQTRPMLDRMLEGKIAEEEKAHPLQLPSPLAYPFAEEDSDMNIVFEPDQTSGGNPVVRGGTLLKLVERLTYHQYASPKFVRTFLTTYRSFCTPTQFLDLLIERFNIPLPHHENDLDTPGVEGLSCFDVDGNAAVSSGSSKRFRKEYVQPVQLRVLNVVRHWVDEHFYDFERDENLLVKLTTFINGRKGKSLSRWIHSIFNIIKRRREDNEATVKITFQTEPPSIEWHLTRNPEEFNIITLHPVEMARQITLIESELYRAVKPSELIGCAWQRENKDAVSPNLLRLVGYTNTLIQWYKKNILEAENLQERVATVARILEMMVIFMELNNFNGVLEVAAAMTSAPIFRLKHTFARLAREHGHLSRSLDEAKELNDNHFRKYIEKLRSINPPVVPFFGMYLTNINHIEEGNPDFLRSDNNLINFSKRRKVAEITGEIQQYQNQRYCLLEERSVMEYLRGLNPLEDQSEKDFDDQLFNKSIELEPRGAESAPHFPPRLGVDLKSPGIRPPKGKTGRGSHASGGGSSGPAAVFTFRPQDVDAESPASPNRISTSSSTPSTPVSPLSPGGKALINYAPGTPSQQLQQQIHHTIHSVREHHPQRTLSDIFQSNPEADGWSGIPVLQPPPIPPRRHKGGGSGGASSGSCTTPSSTHSNHESPLQSPLNGFASVTTPVNSNNNNNANISSFNGLSNVPPLSPSVISSYPNQPLPPPLPLRRRDPPAIPDCDENDPPRTPPHLPPRIQPSSSSNVDVVPPLPPRGSFSHVRTPSGALKLSRPPPIIGGNFPPPPPSPIVNLPHAGSPTFNAVANTNNSAQTSPVSLPSSSSSSSANAFSNSCFRSAPLSASAGGAPSHPPMLARRHSARTFFPHDMTLPLPSNPQPSSAAPHFPHHSTHTHMPPAHSSTPSVFDNNKFEFPSAGFSEPQLPPDAPIPQLPPKTAKYHRKKSDGDL